MASVFTDLQTGSSPRVRGTRCFCANMLRGARFIPACAGNTGNRRGKSADQSVHPRVCGEHWPRLKNVVAVHGSSPRVRGTLPRHLEPVPIRRFIPACAGNTLPIRTRRATAPVHPRVCGEHTILKNDHVGKYGSSPRVRGTLRERLLRFVDHRFIPACAGNTTAQHRIRSTLPVHPRVCGEHQRL